MVTAFDETGVLPISGLGLPRSMPEGTCLYIGLIESVSRFAERAEQVEVVEFIASKSTTSTCSAQVNFRPEMHFPTFRAEFPWIPYSLMSTR